MVRSAIVTVNASSPKISTSISINVSPTSGNVPFDISVTGKLTDSAGNPLIGKSVVLYINGAYVDTRITQGGATAGQYGFSVVITAVGTHQCQVVFAGDDTYAGCSSATITVNAYAPRISTSISINVSPTFGTIPLTVSVNGKLVDSSGIALNGKTINLYSNAILVGTTTTAADGSYAFSVNITAAGTYQFQVEFPGDAAYEGCAEHDGARALAEAGAFTIKGKAFTFPIPPGSVEAVVTVDAVQYKTPFEEEIPAGTKIFKASWNEQTLEEEVNVDKDMTILFLFDPAGILNRTLVLPTEMLPPIPLPS